MPTSPIRVIIQCTSIYLAPVYKPFKYITHKAIHALSVLNALTEIETMTKKHIAIIGAGAAGMVSTNVAIYVRVFFVCSHVTDHTVGVSLAQQLWLSTLISSR